MPTSRPTAKKPHEARLLALAAWVLSEPEPVTRAQIFARFPRDYAGRGDTPERKLTRDKDALRRLGFLLEKVDLGDREDQAAYTIAPRASLLPPIDLTADEAAAAWTAGLAALRLSDHPLRDDLASALRKLAVGARGLPPRAAAAEDLVTGGHSVPSAFGEGTSRPPEPPLAPAQPHPAGPSLVMADGAPDAERLLPRLVDAWQRRRRLRVSYWRVSEGKAVERDVDVYGWARRRGEWIFVGHCHLRRAVRIFYLSRVRALRLAALPREEAAARRRKDREGDYDVPASFDIRAWSRQQIWDYDVHPPRAAAVRFRGSLTGLARQLLPGARVSTDEAGARVARLEVRNLRGLVRQALAWGPDAEVIEPPEARALARGILASLASLASLAPGEAWGRP